MPQIVIVAAAALAGWLFWSLLEYVIHGVLAHRFRTFVSPLHWSHHRTPAAVFTSPLAWVPLAALLGALAIGVGGFALGGSFFVGVLAGFLHYEFVHWRIHFRKPRGRRQERLRAHHLAHHFVNPKAYHGVTTPFWDHVFGSRPAEWATDYARGSAREPIPGESNLRAGWSPRVTASVVREAFRRGAPS
jgi:sterol desaturase/sphingolipid hydroxylase (fatty acid hydroxylase superfamily)